jgi:hypothetical protein
MVHFLSDTPIPVVSLDVLNTSVRLDIINALDSDQSDMELVQLESDTFNALINLEDMLEVPSKATAMVASSVQLVVDLADSLVVLTDSKVDQLEDLPIPMAFLPPSVEVQAQQISFNRKLQKRFTSIAVSCHLFPRFCTLG